jgi:sodium transport system permease protein
VTYRGEAGIRRTVLATLFRYEMKMLLRDRRTVFFAVVAPLVLFPVLLLAIRSVERSEARRLERATYRYAVVGDRAEWARELVVRALSEEPDSAPSRSGNLGRFEEVMTSRPDSLFEAGDLHVVVEGLSAEAYRSALESDTAWWGSSAEPDSADLEWRERQFESSLPVLRIRFRGRSDLSRTGSTRLRERILELRSELRDSVFRARGFPVRPGDVAEVEVVSMGGVAGTGRALLGEALLPVFLLLMLTGGSIAGADAIAGEKERGTLETLLTSAARRSEIVSAKQLGVIVVGLAVAVINVVNLLVYLVLGVIELPEGFDLSLSLMDLLLLLLILVPLAVLVSNALLLLSGYARSYREYQIYFFPLLLVFVLPTLVAFLPGIELRSAIAFVPVAGIAVGVREIMIGEFDSASYMLAFVSTSLVAIWLSNLTERALSTERLISASDLDEADLVGGPALFPRHVLSWFLGLWVIFYVVSLWFGNELGVQGQVFVNLVGIFLGGSVFMIRRYRLPVREVLALRPVPVVVWLAVLLGAPSAHILGIGIADFVDTWLFPVPQELIEAFGQALMGQDLPLWKLILFFAVMPGIFEEIAFRGVLLYGLRKRLHPVALCLAVGGIFGFFHVSLFRIVPTAYMGAVLTATVLLTGSILPAMVWHMLHNGVALVSVELGWIDANQSPPPSWYLAALVGLAVAFAILWLARRPYPGLRMGRRRSERR